MKRFFLFLMLLFSPLVLMPAYADTVTLLNGNTVEGKITERTGKYIKIETEGMVLTYYSDEIKNIHESNKHEEAAKEENFKPKFKTGKWSMTTTTQMEGLPPEAAEAMNNISPEKKQEMMDKMKEGMKKQGGELLSLDMQGATTTMTVCMTKQPSGSFNLNNAMYNTLCHESHETEGNTYHFMSTCNMGAVSVSSSGSMTYNSDSMEGEIKMHTVAMNHTMNSTINMTGKYLGPC